MANNHTYRFRHINGHSHANGEHHHDHNTVPLPPEITPYPPIYPPVPGVPWWLWPNKVDR